VLDATVRYLVLTGIGLLLLAVLPSGALGTASVWQLHGRPGPTVAILLGLAVIFAAWIYFSVVVVAMQAARRPDTWITVALTVDVVALAAFLAAVVMGRDDVAVALLGIGTLAQLAIAARVQQRTDRMARSET